MSPHYMESKPLKKNLILKTDIFLSFFTFFLSFAKVLFPVILPNSFFLSYFFSIFIYNLFPTFKRQTLESIFIRENGQSGDMYRQSWVKQHLLKFQVKNTIDLLS